MVRIIQVRGGSEVGVEEVAEEVLVIVDSDALSDVDAVVVSNCNLLFTCAAVTAIRLLAVIGGSSINRAWTVETVYTHDMNDAEEHQLDKGTSLLSIAVNSIDVEAIDVE